jgi:predicted O-linked N-acetylglucosamine transferase (SPINDLY family)
MNRISNKERARTHLQAGRLEEARQIYRQVCRKSPDDIEAWHMLSAVNGMLGRYVESADCARKVIQLNPAAVPAYNNLAVALLAQNEPEPAKSSLDQALKLNPRDSETLNNLGSVSLQSGRLTEATTWYRKAITLRPDYGEAHNNLGNALLQLHRPDEALRSLQTALGLNPVYPDALFNAGKALQALGRHMEAMQAYERTLQLQPAHIDAQYAIGDLLHERGAYLQAGERLEHVLQATPGDARILGALAGIRKDCGLVGEAIDLYRQAVAIAPDIPGLYSNYLLSMHYSADDLATEIIEKHRAWASLYQEQHPPVCNPARPGSRDRLTIGYVSHDFRAHSVAFFTEPVIASHDRERFRVVCYASIGRHRQDEVTERIRHHSELWRDITDMDDLSAARLIENDGVDVLVDLAGHTAWNRLGIFACKPAPVQITYLGYPNTTGLTTMDYRLTDAVADPEDEDSGPYAEELLRLPDGFLTYLPPAVTIAPGNPPCISNGHVTFGSFNALPKISGQSVSVWCELLGRLTNARMLLKNHTFTDDGVRRRILAMFTSRGIAADRVELMPPCPSTADHLALYNRIDIALDSFPYNGTTTSCEALWMGVPVITLAGRQHVSRVGHSILQQIGLGDLAAADVDGYVDLAIRLAGNFDRLSELRRTLRQRIGASTLGDHVRFTRGLEALYERIWKRCCTAI